MKPSGWECDVVVVSIHYHWHCRHSPLGKGVKALMMVRRRSSIQHTRTVIQGNLLSLGMATSTTDSAQHMCWWLKSHGNEGRPEKTEYHITSNRAPYHKDQDKHVIHKLYFPLTDGHTNEGRQEHNDRTGRQRRPPYRKRHSRGWSMRNKWLADRMWMYWAEFEIGDDGCGNFYLLVRGNAD